MSRYKDPNAIDNSEEKVLEASFRFKKNRHCVTTVNLRKINPKHKHYTR